MILKSGNGGVLPPKDERRRILDAKGGCLAPMPHVDQFIPEVWSNLRATDKLTFQKESVNTR